MGRGKVNVIRDRMVYKTVLSLVTIGVSGLIRLVFSVLVGRVFGASVLGHVNTVISAAVFATLLCAPGMGQAVARYLATAGLDGTSAVGRRMLAWATVIHHLVCLGLSVLVAVLVPVDGWPDRLLVLGLTFGYGTYTYYKAVLYGVDRVERYAVLELSWDGMFVLALIAVAVSGSSHWVLAPLVLVYLGFSLGAHVSLFPRIAAAEGPARTDAVERRKILSFAAITTVGTVSSAGFLQLSQIFAFRADPGHGAGLFTAAMTLVTPAYLLPRAISVVLFPAMARAAGKSDRQSVRRQLDVGTNVLAAAMLPGFALVGMMATSLVTLFYSESFAAAGPTLVVMVWATWVSIASVPAVNALSSDTGRSYLVPAGASVLGFLIGLGWWLIAGTSILAVAWGYLAGSVVQSAIPMVECWRRHGVPSASLIARTLLVAAVGLVAGLLMAAQPTGEQLLAGIAAAAIAAAAVFPELRSLVRVSIRPAVG